MARPAKLIDLSSHLALRIIRKAAADSANVFLTNHASVQMRKRNITMTQVLGCLRKGRISEGPAKDVMKGGWKCTVEHYTAGEQIGASVGIESLQSTSVTVITVFHVG